MGKLIQIVAVLFLLTSASAAAAQTLPACGIVGIDGPTQVDTGAPLVFKANTTALHTTRPDFKWTVSAGTITTGQGTDEIAVDTAGLAGVKVSATVELAGAPVRCKGSDSKTVQVKAPDVIGCSFDNYGDLKFENEKARLDNFAIQLINEPLAIGYILVSAGQETFAREAEERLNRARSYLADVREIYADRIVTVDCGFSQALTTRLWIVPSGAKPPVCHASEIPLSEVKFTKPRPKSRP